MKKLLAFILAMMLVLSMASIAVAEGTTTYTITINPKDSAEHTYEVYQIFTGDVATKMVGEGENAKPVTYLANIDWGINSKHTDPQNANEEAEKLAAKAGATADDVKVYCDFTTTPIATITKTDAGYVSAPLAPGYYLIKDKDGSLKDDQGKEMDGAYTTLLVQVLSKNISVTAKSAKPTVDKQVWDETSDAEAGHTNGWGESADHNLFEEFQFKLIAKLPGGADYADYSKSNYIVEFTDTMSTGVTFVKIDSVTVGGTELTAGQYNCTAYNGQKGNGTDNWKLRIENVQRYATLTNSTTIEVLYTAYLNEEAQVFNASAGATTNKNSVFLRYSNNPNVAGDMGMTTEDHVWLFTYVVNNTKYANSIGKDNKLAGAGFTLYTDEECTKVVKLLKSTTESGLYMVYGNQESIPDGYEAVENNEMVTGADGKFNIKGLDCGTYYLRETTTPDGYNTLANQMVIITATHKEKSTGDDAEMTLTDSNMNNDIVNKSGATLPETGGIGTTIFYVLGGVMFAGAALMLVVRRKAEADEN